MEASSSSFVSKARTAFHSAAAKAERVFTDIKSDLIHDRDCERKSPANISNQAEYEAQEDVVKPKGNHETKHLRWKPPPISLGTKQEWQDRLKNIRLGRKEINEIEKAENSTMSFPIYDENLFILNAINDAESKGSNATSSLESLVAGNVEKIPSSSVIKQLAVATENGKKFNSMKDFLVSSRDSSPVRERANLTLSAVKSLVLREKDEHMKSEPTEDEKVVLMIQLLFNSEGGFLRRNVSSDSESAAALVMLKDIHAAPLDTFIVKLAEVIGSLKTMRKMALFWCQVVAQLRRLWYEKQYIAGIPLDQTPDLNCCLLYQQLQVMNCCVARKRRHSMASEALDTTIREASSNNGDATLFNGLTPINRPLFVRVNNGEAVLRLGADHPSGDLIMLETGEPVFSPVTQECPLFTEDLIKETEEFVLRTGSVGAGCSQLLSDMQAFKAANPGCILEDFVRWHSPPDWTEAEQGFDHEDPDGSTRGQLSNRMQKKGLWHELWETAKPIPAVKQTPLYDEELAVEGILDFLDDIPPLELFEQLFVSLIGVGFVITEASMASDSDLSKLFYECKDYVVAACQANVSEKLDDLCQVYETVETMLLKPEELLKTMKQPGDTGNPVGELRRRFKRLTLNFGNKDKSSREEEQKTQKTADDSASRQPFASFFDSKSSLFSKKPPKPGSASPVERSTLQDDTDWTIV